MLFLLRPRQTRMPYALPRDRAQQEAYNQQSQDAYASTRRVVPAPPAPSERDPIADLRSLAELHTSGALTDAEFAATKAKVLSAENDET